MTIYENWDPSLALVMCGGLAVTFITFPYIIKSRGRAVYVDKISIPTNNTVDIKLILGASLFGIGWGLSGLCPGPAMIDFFTLTHIILWLPMLALGQIVADLIDK